MKQLNLYCPGAYETVDGYSPVWDRRLPYELPGSDATDALYAPPAGTLLRENAQFAALRRRLRQEAKSPLSRRRYLH